MMRNLFWTILFVFSVSLYSDNQTPTTTPVLPPDSLPFVVSIDLMDIELPNGWHSGAYANWGDKTFLIAGRTNGMHGFSNIGNNFPPQAQNTVVYVIDFKNDQVWQRSLFDPNSGLTQEQIDTLSVTSPQFHQRDDMLYITGGYGIETATGLMTTKPVLSAISIPGIITWVTQPQKKGTLAKHLRQVTDPLVQVTGGYMDQISSHHPTLLFFGQNFTGLYRDGSNGDYTLQVRTFHILDYGGLLEIVPTKTQPAEKDVYRRRDLNVVPIMSVEKGKTTPAFAALSGVFTETSGIWTVPVIISGDGESFMANPSAASTFKQGMNNYICPTVGLFSNETQDMYVISFGGITYGFFVNGIFVTDPEFPFTNQVTTIKRNRKGVFSQYIMENEYPVIISTFSNPGNVLLFGAGGIFVEASRLPTYTNAVIKLDCIDGADVVIGYIVGGIQSTLPNTITPSDSAASPYIFKVTLRPR